MPRETPLRCPLRTLRFAIRLRSRMTEAEKVLWKVLRRKECGGMKFRRQVPLGEFIVDFLCVEQCLIVEVDGAIHEKQQWYDRSREASLRRYGYRIIRFRNEEVLRNLPTVLETIVRCKK